MIERHYLHWILLFALMIGTLLPASLLFAASPRAPLNTIVISQVYGGGGNSGAQYRNDFVELFNRGTTPVTLTGWTVQYASATGPAPAASWVSTTLTGTIAPGKYYLVQEASGGAIGAILPTADLTGTFEMNTSAGKVALVMTTTLLSGTCPLSTTTTIVDFIGYGTPGSHINCFETAAAQAPSNTTADLRKNDGCTETDDNSADFISGAGNPPNPRNSASPAKSCTPPPAEKLLITEVLFDGTQTDEGDEFIEITNPLTYTVDLTGYKIGDEETKGAGEGMYSFPAGATLASNAVLVIAKNAAQFHARFGADPAFELVTSGSGLTDTVSVPNLAKSTAWASGSLALSNSGDEVLLLGPSDELVDSVAWGSGNFAAVGLAGEADANEPLSLQRYGAQDSNNMTFDFLRAAPAPGTLVSPPAPHAPVPGAPMPGGMFAYWGDLHAHSTASDGSGPPRMAYAAARAAGLHFFALTDHDGWLTPEEWNEIGSAASAATTDRAFIALRAFEFTSPDGHVNAFNTSTWVSHTDPNYNSLPKFYAWLTAQPNALAQFNHPVWDRGGDFNNLAFDSSAGGLVALQELGNNAGAVYGRFEAQYILALNHGWRVAPTNDSDNHALNWGSDSAHRVGVLAPALTAADLVEAFRARRTFATEDANLALALQANGAWMGSTIRAQPTLNITVTVSDPDAEPLQLDLFDNGAIVRAQAFSSSTITWTLQVAGSSSHNYFVRATQADGDLAYSAPIWTDDTQLPMPPAPTQAPHEKRWDVGNVSIETARTKIIGTWVDLEACVTVAPGVFSDRFIFIQDQMGGIKVYLSSRVGDFPALRNGDRVALRGRTYTSYGEREVNVEDDGTIKPVGVCPTLAPKRYATGTIDKPVEGWLAEVSGTVKSVDRGEFVLNDGSGDALVYIDTTTGIRLPRLAVGQGVRVIGVVSRAHNKSAIMPRFTSDLIVAPAPTVTPRATPTRSPTTTPRVSAPAAPTATATRVPATPSPTARAFLRATPAPAAESLDAHALAVAGGSTSIAAGFVLFAIGAVLFSRQTH